MILYNIHISLERIYVIMSTYRKRKPKIRYDRIIGVAAILIVLLILVVSCCKSCGNDDKKNQNTSSIVPTDNKEKDKGSENSAPSDDSSLASLDSYSTISAMPNDIYAGDLVLVNKQHEYSFPATEENSKIVPVYETKSDSYQVNDYETYLDSNTIKALNSLLDAFYNESGLTDIMVISGYRTKEYQDELFNAGTSDVKGGCSEYHTGLSLDLGIFPQDESSYYYIPDGKYAWIEENCAKYGFVIRYPEGKEDKTGMESKSYQFRYVGIPHAIYINDNNLCLEEYIDLVKNYTFDGEHLKVAGTDKNYEIYYVSADPSSNTDIPVPGDKTYSVSGNNIDGFIVTVEI